MSSLEVRIAFADGWTGSYANKASTAGILGVIAQQDSSMFASPYGGVFSSGAHDEDIFGNMTGREVGEAYGVGGLGIVGTGPGGDGLTSGVIGLSTAGAIGYNIKRSKALTSCS